MSGPIGSEYPGNLVMVAFAGMLAYLSGASAIIAYRHRHGGAGKFDWRRNVGVAVISFSMFVGAVWAIWTHMRSH